VRQDLKDLERCASGWSETPPVAIPGAED
jgi:hypothetical protein